MSEFSQDLDLKRVSDGYPKLNNSQDYSDVIVGTMASQISGVSIVY